MEDGPSAAELERRERATAIVGEVLSTLGYSRKTQSEKDRVWEAYGIENWVGATVCVISDPVYVTILGNSPELHRVGANLEKRFKDIDKRVVIGYDS